MHAEIMWSSELQAREAWQVSKGFWRVLGHRAVFSHLEHEAWNTVGKNLLHSLAADVPWVQQARGAQPQ
jgi:hypothetical protein